MYSATWMDYLSTPSRLMFPLWSFRFFMGTALFPGAVGLALAAVAVVRGDAFRDPRARMCLAVGIAGVALSFGPKMPGYAALYTVIPVLRADSRDRSVRISGHVVGRRARRIWRRLTAAYVACARVAGTHVRASVGRLRRDIRRAARPDTVRRHSAHLFARPARRAVTRRRNSVLRVGKLAVPRVVHVEFDGQLAARSSTATVDFSRRVSIEHAQVLQGFPDEASLALLHGLGITHVFVHTTQVSKDTLAQISQERQLKLDGDVRIDLVVSIGVSRTGVGCRVRRAQNFSRLCDLCALCG